MIKSQSQHVNKGVFGAALMLYNLLKANLWQWAGMNIGGSALI